MKDSYIQAALQHAEEKLIRACIQEPDRLHSISIILTRLTRDQATDLYRHVLNKYAEFRPTLQVDEKFLSQWYGVQVNFRCLANDIRDGRILMVRQEIERQIAAAAPPHQRSLMTNDIWRIHDHLFPTELPPPGLPKERPTTVCSWCPCPPFPTESAYRSAKTGVIICPDCFHKAEGAGRAHLKEESDANLRTEHGS